MNIMFWRRNFAEKSLFEVLEGESDCTGTDLGFGIKSFDCWDYVTREVVGLRTLIYYLHI
jgi:hypothetical protein